MNSTYLLTLTAFGVFALFGVLSWVLSYKHPQITGDPAMQRRVRRWAIIFPLMGVVFGYGAFTINNKNRVQTLHEVMVEGTLDMQPGAPAAARHVSFTVEHPGVEHDLMISPTSTFWHHPKSAVDVSFSLHGPGGQLLIPESTVRFAVRGRSRSRPDWEARHYDFTPSVAGQHTVLLTPLTNGIPGIHVRIADPLKRDGERMPGY